MKPLPYQAIVDYIKENGPIVINHIGACPEKCKYFLGNDGELYWRDGICVSPMPKETYIKYIELTINNAYFLEQEIRKRLSICQRLFYEL